MSRSPHMIICSPRFFTTCAYMSFTAFAKTSAGSFPFVDGEASLPMRKTSSMPDVHRVGVEGVDDLVDQGIDDLVDARVQGVPLAAVDALVLREGARSQVERGVLREQRPRVLGPRLVAEALELRDHPDAVLPAGRHEPPGPGAGHHLLRDPQLGVRAELEGVVDLEDEDVHPSRREIGELALDRLEVGVVLEPEEVQGDPRGVGLAPAAPRPPPARR